MKKQEIYALLELSLYMGHLNNQLLFQTIFNMKIKKKLKIVQPAGCAVGLKIVFSHHKINIDYLEDGL